MIFKYRGYEIKIVTEKTIPVKSLFTIANSFAPAASNIANAMITSPANKSG